MKYYFFIFQLFYLSLANDQADLLKAEYNLIQNKFTNNIKIIRPSFQVNITVDLALKQIISIDEKTQVITTSTYLFVSWEDSRLCWNKSENNVERIPVQAKNIWLPDLFVENAVDTNSFLPIYDSNILWVYFDGTVHLTVSLNSTILKYFLKLINFKLISI